MNFEITQALQQKLERRVERLKTVDGRFLSSLMKQFFTFLENEPILQGVLQGIETEITNKGSYDSIGINNQFDFLYRIETEDELLKFSYFHLKKIARDIHYSKAGGLSAQLKIPESELFNHIIRPFCDYLFEQINSQKVMLSLLYRYKHKCEWFQQERLLKLYNNETKKGEKLLALDLYEYLFDQGINFTIEPSSIDGAIDMISAQNSDDPLLADAKIFKGDKSYICKGFGQLYSYTKKYNEPFGYLVIYNVTDKDLSFLFSNSTSNIPVVTYNHKTIFLITIDLYKHPEPPSKRGIVKTIEIREEDLFEFAEN